jgi:pilus assembly protein CpaC
MKRRWLLLFALALFAGLSVTIFAEAQVMEMTAGDSKVIVVAGLSRISTSNPEIVQVVVTSGQEVLINAKKTGLAVVNIWGVNGLFVIRIVVHEDYTAIEHELALLIKNPNIKITVNAKYIVLEGPVENSLDADQAILYAKMYRDNVISNLEAKVKYQILLTILVTEVRKDIQNKYGFRWGSWVQDSAGTTFNDWQWGFIEKGQNSFGKFPNNWWIGSMLDAMEKNGDAKILAAPTILTLSGKEAFFLAGGEIPIPLADGQGGVKVEWKEYGIKLKATPTIGREEIISMVIAPEVSSLDWANAILIGGDKLPALATRKVITNVQFKDGATLVIGGLLKREDSTAAFKLPILGDLPIIGPLFRSKDFQTGRTELLIFVTPRIIRNGEPIDPKKVVNPEPRSPHFESP